MAKRTIAHVGFRYHLPLKDKEGNPVTGPDGKQLYQQHIAAKGETVDIPLKEDLDLGERFGAFETSKSSKADADEGGEPDA